MQPDIRTLPQWAQIYIRKLELSVATQRDRADKNHSLYIAGEEEITLLKERLDRYKFFIEPFEKMTDVLVQRTLDRIRDQDQP